MKAIVIGAALGVLLGGTARANCVGYAGPGGPCSTGPGGGLSTGPGGGLSTGPGGGLSTGPGGGLSTGPGGGLSTGPGGGLSNGPNPWRRVPAPTSLGDDSADDDTDDE
jgi:hypothetical protein